MKQTTHLPASATRNAHAFRAVLDGAALPPGLYVVRAEVRPDGGGARVFTRPVALLR